MEDLVGLLQAKGGLHSPREPTRLKSTVIFNYLGAMLLTALGVFATAMVVRDLLGGR